MNARRGAVRRFRRHESGWAEDCGQPVEWLLIVENDDWHTAIARGDRAEIERIYRSMFPKVAGLRIEAA